jgi:hypothetical protein
VVRTYVWLTPGGRQVLAWGNSVGDLVADVVIARAGQPKTAVAGCYAGPLFNMLIGLGLALTIKTAAHYPVGEYHDDRRMALLSGAGITQRGTKESQAEQGTWLYASPDDSLVENGIVCELSFGERYTASRL